MININKRQQIYIYWIDSCNKFYKIELVESRINSCNGRITENDDY